VLDHFKSRASAASGGDPKPHATISASPSS
jgi:hypothetical protein